MADTADNIALVRNVCLFRAQSPRTSAGRRGRNASVVAHVWADERSGSLGTLCGRPPACYQARAFEYCAMRAHGTAMIARATSFDAVAVGGAYPPPCAARVRRLAIGRITSNVGHDLFLEGLSDLFAQQQLGGGPGFFDAVLLEAFWFHSARSFHSALRSPNASWTLSMASALFNATIARNGCVGGCGEGTALLFSDHRKGREPIVDKQGRLLATLPPGGLRCGCHAPFRVGRGPVLLIECSSHVDRGWRRQQERE